MHQLTLTIDGKSVPTENTFDVINPATEKVLAKCPKASTEELELAVQSAHNAFATWRNLSWEKRAETLKKAGDILEKHIDDIAKLLSQEQGKTLPDAISEVESSISRFKNSGDLKLSVEIAYEDDKNRIELHHKPLGVVAVITPWNYPVNIAVGRAVTAMLAGNTVVIKPSPYTPLSTLLVGELLHDVFPAGVWNVIAGDDKLGAALTKHPLIRKISFTGSVPTGKAIAAVAAHDLKRVTLELGGNDAAIILDDVDVKKIAEPLFWGAFENTGQVCIAIKRLYVHEKVFEPLVAELKSIAESLNMGDGLDPESQLGPLNNKAQLDIVTDLVEDAEKQGATIVTGGKRIDRPGYFYQPTLVTNIKEGTRLVDEEQFGPALPIIKYSDLDDVIKRANETKMGLGGSVWGSDIARATDIASQLECGTAWVNAHCETTPNAPFGGVKHSGIGREFGIWGLEETTDLQTVNISKR